MSVDTIAILLCLIVPPIIGASPALLPRLPMSARWALAGVLLAASLWFHHVMNQAPHPFHLAYVVPFWLGWIFGVVKLLSAQKPR